MQISLVSCSEAPGWPFVFTPEDGLPSELALGAAPSSSTTSTKSDISAVDVFVDAVAPSLVPEESSGETGAADSDIKGNKDGKDEVSMHDSMYSS